MKKITRIIASQFLFAGILLAQSKPDWTTSLEKQIRSQVATSTDFTVQLPAPADKRSRSAAEFGFYVTNSPAANTQALQHAIDTCREDGTSELLIPPGRYRMGKFEASMGDSITHSPTTSHYTGRLYQVKLLGLQDFTLNGQGAELIFCDLDELPADRRRLGAFFIVKDCQRVLITDLIVDWDWDKTPLACYGQITAIDEAHLSVDYEMDGDSYADRHIEIMREWDRSADFRNPDVFSFAMGHVADYKWLSDRTVRFRFKNKNNLKNAKMGDWGVFKLKTRYAPVGFSLDLNEHLTLDKVNIYSAVENAVWTRQNKYLQIINSRIVPRPGAVRPLWSSNGGLEVHNTFGYFRLENCEISYVLDDALHFSDFFLAGNVERLGDHSFKVGGLMYFQSGDTFIKGSRLAFFQKSYEPAGFSAEIADSKWTFDESGTARHFVIVTTKEKLPEKIDPDTLLFNDAYGVGRYVIRNNYIHNGGCHGLYVCMGNGLIEGNRIERTGYPALTVHSLVRWGRWPMGHPPSNVIVRDNVIRNCNTAMRLPADLFIGGGYDPQGGVYKPTQYPIARNIIVENNTIEGSSIQAVAAWACKNILIQNNLIRDPNQRPSPKGQSGAVFIRNAENIYFAGNTLVPLAGSIEEPFIATGLASNIVVEANIGFGGNVK